MSGSSVWFIRSLVQHWRKMVMMPLRKSQSNSKVNEFKIRSRLGLLKGSSQHKDGRTLTLVQVLVPNALFRLFQEPERERVTPSVSVYQVLCLWPCFVSDRKRELRKSFEWLENKYMILRKSWPFRVRLEKAYQ